MQFYNLTFLFLFLPILGLLFYICPVKWRRFLLILASVVFYGAVQPLAFLVLLVVFSLLDYGVGLLLSKKSKPRLALLIGAVAVHVGVLLVCKLGSSTLPVGLSFFTLQAISYLVDIYFEAMEPERRISHLVCYLLFFPRLLAGPVERYADRNETLDISLSKELLADGIGSFVRGFGKKILLGDQFGRLFALIRQIPQGELSVATSWLGLLTFFLWIYFDFSGYCDMAVGVGKMFGITLPQNFNYPLMMLSAEDFLNRFHITLSNWFSLYIYLPLKKRCKHNWMTAPLLLITWGLMGCWHGLSVHYLLWGLGLGLLICGEQFLYKPLSKAPTPFRRIYALLTVGLLWVLFFSEDLATAGSYYASLFGVHGWYDSYTLPILTGYGALLVIGVIGASGWARRAVAPASGKYPRVMRVCGVVYSAALLFCSIALVLQETPLSFYYFRF